jgi:hypothetical protein
VDVITVAQAIHWFDPLPARREMMRIFKAGGWLALLRNFGVNEELNAAIKDLMSPEYGADISIINDRSNTKPHSFYYGNTDYHTLTFPFQFHQNFEQFIGALTTAAYMPDDDHPLYNKLETIAKEIFTRHSECGLLSVNGKTELIIGQPVGSGFHT